MWMDDLKEQLKRHEGVRLKPYRDTVGKLTIGVGHNLDDLGLSNSIIDYILIEDINNCITQLQKDIKFYNDLSEVRKRVIIDMCFNMGINTLLTFKQTLHNIEIGNYELAADQMLQSTWAKQVGQRSIILSYMMRNDKEYKS